MSIIRIISIFLIAAGLSTTPVWAEQLATPESIEKMIKVSKADKMFDGIYDQMDQMFKASFANQSLSGDEMLIVDKYVMKLQQLMKDEMGWDEIKGPIIDVYAKHFTQKEIDGMTAFYETEIGQSMMEKMPILMGDLMPTIMGIGEQLQPKMEILTQELAQELQTLQAAEE